MEESNLICIFAGEGRSEVIEDIERALPYLDASYLTELSCAVYGKAAYKLGMHDDIRLMSEVDKIE